MSQSRALQRLSALSAHLLGSRNAASIGIKARRASSEAGDGNTGHITTTSQQSILYFSGLYPMTLLKLTTLPSFLTIILPKSMKGEGKAASMSAGDPERIVQEAALTEGITDIKVVEILPRLKEGGAFVKFEHRREEDAKAVSDAVIKHLGTGKFRPWWDPFHALQVSLVLGKPWIEDLSRMPSRRLKVEFLPTAPDAAAAELSQEQLYSFFRPFGKLADIVTQPSDSKVVPRFAYVDFTTPRKAIMSKNCMHGYVVTEKEGGGKLGTVLRLTYERKPRFKWISDWIFSHPRIVFPVIAAFLAGITVAIFDPIRTTSIKLHITQALHVENSRLIRWFRSRSEDLINKVRELQGGGEKAGRGMTIIWDDRRESIQQIQTWLAEDSDSFIIVQGPKGSGKKELVLDHALQRKREAHKVLVLDCKPIQEARVFSWLNSISGLVDLAAQGTTGVKTGFSETLENQFVKILNQTAAALKSISLDSRNKKDKDADLGNDEWLEAHPELRPVVVIDSFLHKSNEPGAELVYDKIAEWAARLTTGNLAHVIFLTHDLSYTKSLSKALPDRVFRQISLQDCSPEVAKRYVISHLDFDEVDKEQAVIKSNTGEQTTKLTASQQRKDLKELDGVIESLGGRLTDLENLSRRVKAGQTPKKAVNEMVSEAASEIVKLYLVFHHDEKRAWEAHQAWALIRELATADTLRYNEVLMTDAFANDGDAALGALEQAELVTIHSEHGRPYSIRPGRPIFNAAFKSLVEDQVLRSKMDLKIVTEQINNQAKGIDKWEQELQLLGQLPGAPTELRQRVKYLLHKINASQEKIETLEKEQGELKGVLLTEY
ncbi:hypothetical protein AMS68_007243 [Peltaster fructicola]|uniref:Mitochondrial escape protein 2 n=1 Tax=Peltaster fructicola TaxID=286661 RepID=A0A6H0Y440_9PEZI|nr:hypothetical protein AMS68_007243 [Peltaster fructicola]